MEGHNLEVEERKGVLEESVSEKKIVVGSVKNPMWIGTTKEAKKLLTGDFYYAYDCWKYFNAGMGLPGIDNWMNGDPILMEAIRTFENHYQVYYRDRHITGRLDALIGRGR